MDKESLYKKCVDFHGHSCGGLLIGFRAALCAMEQFGISEPSPDEELVCIAENDACGIDAIQALLGCRPSESSSSIISFGRDIRPRAMAHICCSPPLIVSAV